MYSFSSSSRRILIIAGLEAATAEMCFPGWSPGQPLTSSHSALCLHHLHFHLSSLIDYVLISGLADLFFKVELMSLSV